MWASNPDISITGSHRDEQQLTVVEHRRFSVGGFLAAAAGISQQKPAAGESWSTENSQGMEVKRSDLCSCTKTEPGCTCGWVRAT